MQQRAFDDTVIHDKAKVSDRSRNGSTMGKEANYFAKVKVRRKIEDAYVFLC